MPSDHDYYVYLYRDPRNDRIRYVGKGVGKRVDRVVRDVYDHGGDPDYAARRMLERDKRNVRYWFKELSDKGLAPSIEIMSCADEEEALAVERSLISALWSSGGLLNRVHGKGTGFGPLGLPDNAAKRRLLDGLTRQELQEVAVRSLYTFPLEVFTGRTHGEVPLRALL